MSETYRFTPSGVCCKGMEIEIEGQIIKRVAFQGGCHGNLQGIASLVEGEDMALVAQKLTGIKCGGKASSCPDQLSIALGQIVEKI